MIGGVMGVSQMSGVSGILPYQAYQHGAAARIRSVYGGMYGRTGQNAVSQGTSAAGVQAGQSAALSAAQTAQSAGAASSVPRIQSAGVVMAGRAANPGAPVEPVSPVNVVGSGSTRSAAIPFLRQGMDPAELAVRMRMQYADPSDDRKAGSVQKTGDERECQTCKERKYQDGSDDSGVSYQTPTHIDPDRAASAVRGHEMEHVVRERASAEREDRRVVSQSVTMHTAICPECGRVYVSGGTTRTTTASDPKPEMPLEQAGEGFSEAA